MAILNKKYGYLFLAEPETGSRSCADAMQQHEGFISIGSHHHTQWELLKKGFLNMETFAKLMTFSVIRNPLDIMVTRVFKGSKYPIREQIKRCIGKRFYHHYAVDRVLRYERGLQDEINKFFAEIGAPSVKLPTIGKSPNKRDWRVYYAGCELEFARSLIPEIEAYGY